MRKRMFDDDPLPQCEQRQSAFQPVQPPSGAALFPAVLPTLPQAPQVLTSVGAIESVDAPVAGAAPAVGSSATITPYNPALVAAAVAARKEEFAAPSSRSRHPVIYRLPQLSMEFVPKQLPQL